jgi:hypothetical protein
MDESLAAIDVALRVLTAVMADNQPDPSDVQELRRLTQGKDYSSVDDMASTVIFDAVKRRRLHGS